MVYTARNEQGMEFRIHNSSWHVEDYDGISLVKRPRASEISSEVKPMKYEPEKKSPIFQPEQAAMYPTKYVVVDLETTGLKPESEEIIEIGAIKVENGTVKDTMSCLIRCTKKLPDIIVSMTGITDDLLMKGIAVKDAVTQLQNFINGYPMVGHNTNFDIGFLQETCKRENVEWHTVQSFDTVKIAREICPGLQSYKLEKLLEQFSLPHEKLHRALNDCYAINGLYLKLNEMSAMAN